MVTRQVLPCLWMKGLVVTETPNLSEVEAGEAGAVGGDDDGGLRVPEGLDSFARVFVGADVMGDVGDAVLVQLPFNGLTGHASGLSKQFGDGLVGVHGVLSGYRKGPPRMVCGGPFGVASGGECSGLSVDPVLNQWQVVGFHLDPDGLESFDECGLDSGAAPGERVKHDTAGWGDEPDQPTHNR